MINVTKPFIPDIHEYEAYLEGIWEREWLTNHGPLVNELELKLKTYLGVDHLLFLNNGTIAIQIAIKALELKGEIITTPFSYVATTSSIVWENCVPIFADIDRETLNIDPKCIEAVITEKTTAILATHVFGNPCDVEAIALIAKKHNLKVIYDAAHAFGTTYKGRSIFEYGDISTTSFHATKLFHTIEGGAVFTTNPAILKQMAYLRNFGHSSPTSFATIGINGKNSEFHAAMGLCNIKYIDAILAKRQHDCNRYDNALINLKVKHQRIEDNTVYNHSYYPIIFNSEAELLKAMAELENHKVFTRRYFYPSLSSLNYVTPQSTPISDDIAMKVLCLPLYYKLRDEEIDMIARILLRSQNY